MMSAQPTCRYCQRLLTEPRTRGSGPNNIYLYFCHACDSEQTFDAKGQSLEYSFMVTDQYCLHFWPQSNLFKIVEYKDGRPHKYVLELNMCPTTLTPENTTVEKIKTLVLFS